MKATVRRRIKRILYYQNVRCIKCRNKHLILVKGEVVCGYCGEKRDPSTIPEITSRVQL